MHHDNCSKENNVILGDRCKHHKERVGSNGPFVQPLEESRLLRFLVEKARLDSSARGLIAPFGRAFLRRQAAHGGSTLPKLIDRGGLALAGPVQQIVQPILLIFLGGLELNLERYRADWGLDGRCRISSGTGQLLGRRRTAATPTGKVGVPIPKGGVQILKGLIEVVVRKDAVEIAFLQTVIELGLGVAQSLQNVLLLLGGPAAEAGLEGIHGGRGDEEVQGFQRALLDAADALHVNVQDADLARALDGLYGGDAV